MWDFEEDLIIRKVVKNVLVIIDTCSAGTMFSQTHDLKSNMVLIGSAGWDEFAYSKGGDQYIG